jgi:hypothetical protein
MNDGRVARRQDGRDKTSGSSLAIVNVGLEREGGREGKKDRRTDGRKDAKSGRKGGLKGGMKDRYASFLSMRLRNPLLKGCGVRGFNISAERVNGAKGEEPQRGRTGHMHTNSIEIT